MPFPVNAANSHPQASGLLIPQVWSPRVLEKFYEFSVLEYIANTDYEGEIRSQGDKVIIRQRPNITISNYEKGQTLPVQRPTVSTVELDIDKGKFWSFLVEDVDMAQADYDYMQDWTADAAETMNENINLDVLGGVAASVAAANQGATAGAHSSSYDMGVSSAPVSLTKANVITKLGHASAVLDEQNVPERDRWMVIPAWMKAVIFDSDIKNALIQGNDQELLRKGHIGELAGFQLFLSNQLTITQDSAGPPVVNAWDIPFGHKSSLTFASQLVHSRVKEPDDYFGLLVQGLNVYGYNLNKPDAAGLLYATPG